MTMLSILKPGLIATIYLMPLSSAAECVVGDITVDNTGLSLVTTTDFDPFLSNSISATTTIFIRNTSDQKCSNLQLKFQDLLTPGTLSALGSEDQISFVLTQNGDNTSLINYPDGISIQDLEANDRISINLKLDLLPVGIAISPGNPYANTNTNLILMAHNEILDNSKFLYMATRVEPLVDINVGGANYTPNTVSTYRMQFGDIANNSSRSVAVVTRANVNHSLRITSDNHGVMLGPQPLTSSIMTYIATFDGNVLNLASGEDIYLGSKTGLDGTSRTLSVDINNDLSIRTGDYHDILTLTITVAP